jgi:hypothetical protein
VPSRVFRVGRSFTGLGLFATTEIKKGAFIVAYTGRRITNAEADELERRGNKYMFEINKRCTIDGSSRKNLGRYANHSCKPNCEAVYRRTGRMEFVAARNIEPEEELTIDYGKDYFALFLRNGGCKCVPCRGKAARRKAAARKASARNAGAKRSKGKTSARKASARKTSARKRKPAAAKSATKRTSRRPGRKRA